MSDHLYLKNHQEQKKIRIQLSSSKARASAQKRDPKHNLRTHPIYERKETQKKFEKEGKNS